MKKTTLDEITWALIPFTAIASLLLCLGGILFLAKYFGK